jgi:hypothetical protein
MLGGLGIPMLMKRNSATFPSSGLLAYWKLDGNSNDDSGNGNDGTDTSISYGAGKISNSAGFNGSTSRIDIPSIEPSSISVSAWVKFSSRTNQIMVEHIRTRDEYFGLNFRGWSLWMLTSLGNVGFSIYTGSTTPGATAETPSDSPAVDTWFHFVGTFDGSTVRVYRNGVEGTSASVSLSYGTELEFANIGVRQYLSYGGDYFSGWWNGNIDEVGIWDRALTADEVAALYNGGAGLTY